MLRPGLISRHGGAVAPPTDSILLLESADRVLLESADDVLLEA